MSTDRLGKELLFFDGGMGTLLQEKGLAPGELPETWNISRPEVIKEIHKRYIEAGSDIILTNTFGANALKYHDDPEIGVYLGRMAAKAILRESAFFEGVDLLLPVPLHRQRLRKRGYNQAERIAQGIHEITNLPIDTTSVIRHVGNESQTHKQVYERMANVCSIFKLVSSENLTGKHILLVDDVITTGSTLSSLSQVLFEIEGIKISVFALSSV